VALLVRQGQRWLTEERPELAIPSAERALSAEPNNIDALLLAARADVARNDRTAASAYVDRLRGAGATPEQLARGDAILHERPLTRQRWQRPESLPAKAAWTKPPPGIKACSARAGRRQPSRGSIIRCSPRPPEPALWGSAAWRALPRRPTPATPQCSPSRRRSPTRPRPELTASPVWPPWPSALTSVQRRGRHGSKRSASTETTRRCCR
jgi:hypothetical protein